MRADYELAAEKAINRLRLVIAEMHAHFRQRRYVKLETFLKDIYRLNQEIEEALKVICQSLNFCDDSDDFVVDVPDLVIGVDDVRDIINAVLFGKPLKDVRK